MAETGTPSSSRGPARARPRRAASVPVRAAAVLAATVVLGALVLLASYLLHSERPLAGTPSPRALFTSTFFTLRAHERVCMSSVTLPPDGRVLQLELGEPPGSARGNPPIDVLLSAPGYRALSHLPGEEPEGQVQLPVRPPPRYVIGSVCLINRGSAPAALAGSTEARSVSRVKLTLGGKPAAGDIALTFFNDRRQSRLSRLGAVFDHASNLTDRLIPVWLIWALAAAVLLVVPIGTLAFFTRALREDEVAHYGEL